jgi:hypothetical protein
VVDAVMARDPVFRERVLGLLDEIFPEAGADYRAMMRIAA